MRAMRADKLVYAALEATLLEHLTGRAASAIPVRRMIDVEVEHLLERAKCITDRVAGVAPLVDISVASSRSVIGGGTTPGVNLPTCVLQVEVAHLSPNEVEASLRASTPPVIARIENDRVCLDLRTVQPDQDEALAGTLIRLGHDGKGVTHPDGER